MAERAHPAERAPLAERIAALIRQDVAWYRGVVARVGEQARVCELGCGGGRIALALAEEGHGVDAVDVDAGALAVLAARLEAADSQVADRVRLVEGDMRRFGQDAAYDAVLLPYQGFQSMTSAQDRHQCLWNAWRILAPDGLLAMDLGLPSAAWLRREPGAWFDVGQLEDDAGTLTLSTAVQVDLLHKLAHVRERWIHQGPAGSTVTESSSTLALIFPDELVLHLELAGFAIEAVRGGYQGEPLEREGQDLVVVARKVQGSGLPT